MRPTPARLLACPRSRGMSILAAYDGIKAKDLSAQQVQAHTPPCPHIRVSALRAVDHWLLDASLALSGEGWLRP